MIGGYNNRNNPLLKGTLSSVDRERLRERSRQARIQMSGQVAEQDAAAGLGAPLFAAPVKVNPGNDPLMQKIIGKLGDYERVVPYLDSRGLIGVENTPQSPGVLPPHAAGPLSDGSLARLHRPASSSTVTRVQQTNEFKKPQQQNSLRPPIPGHHQSQQRGVFAKPADGKPQDGRSAYPGPPAKHGSSNSSSASHRSNGGHQPKGPPPVGSGSASSTSPMASNRIHNVARTLPRIQMEPHLLSSLREERIPSVPDQVQNIFKEMIDMRTPVTAIAATPRNNEQDKFVFNNNKLTEVAPPRTPPILPPRTPPIPPPMTPPNAAPPLTSPTLVKRREPTPTTREPQNLLKCDLELSETDDDQEREIPPPPHPIRLLSPIAQTPAQNTTMHQDNIPDHPNVPTPAASSSSDSDSASDSDSSSEESAEETVPPQQAKKVEEEKKGRPNYTWNLGAYLPPTNNVAGKIAGPDHPSIHMACEEELEHDLSVMEVLKSVKMLPFISSLSESDSGNSGNERAKLPSKRKRSLADPVEVSDSESDRGEAKRTSKVKPANRVTVRPKPIDSDSNSGVDNIKKSDIDVRTLQLPPKPVQPEAPTKPKQRGRPKKTDAPKPRRGRPPLPKTDNPTGSTEKRRGRPPSKPKPPLSPYSSDDERVKPPFEKLAPRRRKNSRPRSSSSSDELTAPRSKSLKNVKELGRSKFSTSKKSHKLKTDDKVQNIDSDSDDEWASNRKPSLPIKDTKRPQESHKRKQGCRRKPPKSEEIVRTSDSDSDSDVKPVKPKKSPLPPPKVTHPPYVSIRSSNSDSDSSYSSDHNMPKLRRMEIDDSKLDLSANIVADKNKRDTLIKLFSQGSGGGKGGKGKGGKGGGAVEVIIKDESSERSNSSVDEDFAPQRTNLKLLSPISAIESRHATMRLTSPRTEAIKPVKTELGQHFNQSNPPSMKIRIPLSFLGGLSKLILKNKTEEVKKWKSSSDNKQETETKLKCRYDADSAIPVQGDSRLNLYNPSESDRRTNLIKVDIDTDGKKLKVPKSESEENGKRKNESDNEGSSKKSWKADNADPVERSEKKRKRLNSSSSTLSTISSLSHSSRRQEHRKEKTEHKTKRRREEDAQTPHDAYHLTNAPPTNHEREGLKTRRQYFSYFECTEEETLDDSNMYLLEAKRLKKQADKENDELEQFMLFIESALYFLLTGTSMDQKTSAFTLFKETQYLLSMMCSSSKFRIRPHFVLIRDRLTVLSSRLQAFLNYSAAKLRMQDLQECNKVISEFFGKFQNQPPDIQHQKQGQGTPSPLSPTPSPAGSIGSVGSQSSGYSSGELATKAPTNIPAQHLNTSTNGVFIPSNILNAILRQEEITSYYASFHLLWEQADDLARHCDVVDFFIQLDKQYKPLTLQSPPLNVVTYMQAAIKRLREERAQIVHQIITKDAPSQF